MTQQHSVNGTERELKPVIYPHEPAGEVDRELLVPIRGLFSREPSVGFIILYGDGTLRYVNRRAAELFTGKPDPDGMVGKSIVELFGREWAEERMGVLEKVVEEETPVLFRHIREGVKLQSTIREITDPAVESHAFSVLTAIGEHDPPEGEDFEVIESDLVHLGPLDPLTNRELEVLALVGHGMSSSQIAKSMHRSIRTVEQHLSGIRNKLGSISRVEMAAYAHRASLTLSDAAKTRLHGRVGE